MVMRYSREELQALRRDASEELPAGVDAAGMLHDNVVVRSKRKRRRPSRASSSSSNKRRRVSADSDEDGDFGGMFDEAVFPGFLEGNDGDYNIEDDDEDDYQDLGPIQKVAFVVEGEPDFDKEEPDDGWEYVRRVKWEAARYPAVKVATISPQHSVDKRTHYVPVVPAISACDPQLLPTQDWEAKFLLTFASLRSRFEAREPSSSDRPVPHMKDDCGWKALCFGKGGGGVEDGVPVAEELEEFGAGPLLFYRGELHTLLDLDEVSRADLLRKHIRWFEGLDHLPHDRAVWLFALTAAVGKPIDAETSFALRTLLRSCAAIRASKTFKDQGELQMLNMIITVAGKYFGQDDSHCL
ncbi:gem-associated protein 2 [Selaginella moellendorffii]|nr:gem-associated protein 2 [Selaginella moellendorffii]|eukprot:XP_002976464.2 gem-associated protein 2 [Selaginella moellendorffii]